MRGIASLVRSVRGAVGESSGDPATTTADPPRSSLFHCSGCDTVYIATEKGTCSTCGGSVEQVPATLEET